MARPQTSAAEQEQRKRPLSEVISDVFSEYFSDLDTLQNAKRVTRKDLDKLDAAKRAIEDCERRAEGGVDGGSKVLLEQLLVLFSAASTNVKDRAEFVEDGAKKGGKEKKKEKANRREPGDDEEAAEQRRSARNAPEAPAEKINVKQEARFWNDTINGLRFDLQRMNQSLLSYDDRAAAEVDEKYFIDTLGGHAVEFAEMLDALGRSGATEIPEILRPVVADFAKANEELAALRERIARFDDLKREREEAARSAEGLAKTFIESAQGAMRDIPRILALPSGTPEERFLLRTELESMVRHFKEYNDLWEKEAKPHLPNGEEWLPAWQQAVQLHRDVHREYRGIKERRMQLEGDRAVDFEKNCNLFMGRVSVFRTRLLEAQTKEGEERNVVLLALQQHLVGLKAEWQDLRQQRPRLSEAERSVSSSEDSPTNQLDRALGRDRKGGIEKEIEGLMAEKDVRALKSYEVIADLARAVVRAHGDIWVASTRYPARDGFLRRYLDGEVKDADPEFAEFVVNRERFREAIGPLSVAYLQVSRERKAREVREERRQARETEREARRQDIERRRSIRHPWVVELRARENDRFARILHSESWKTQNIRERRQIIERVADMTDEALAEKLEGVPAFRKACAQLQDMDGAIRGAETEIIEGRELHPDITKSEAQDMVERYHKLRRLQNAAGKRLEQSRAWSPRVQDRFAAAIAFRGTLFARNPKNVVRQAFQDIAANPQELAPLMEQWIDATSERFALGEAIRFALETRPELQRRGALRGLPKEFRPAHPVAVPEGATAEEFAAAAAEAVADAAADANVGEEATGFGADIGGGLVGDVAALMRDVRDDSGDQSPAIDGAVEALPALSSATDASRAPELAPIDARRGLLRENEAWKTIQRALSNNVFWNSDVSSGSRATKLSVFRRNGTGMLNNNGLREDRIADFQFALAFTDIADLERRVAEVVAKYTEATSVAVPVADVVQTVSEPPAPEVSSVAPAPEAVPSVAPVASLVPPPLRPDAVVPSAPQSATEGIASGTLVTARLEREAPREEPPVSATRVESAPVRPVPTPSSDPFERFFGGGSSASVPEMRPAERAEAPRPSRAESAPVPLARPAPPVERAPEPVAPALRVETPRPAAVVEAPREPHAEERVASWSRSIRNTVGRWFGGSGAESRVAESSPVAREIVPAPEVSRRTAGGVMGVLSRFFGPKVFVDVPQYLPESFGDANARALLQADILDAMEANSAAMKNVAGDPDRIHAANLDAAQRLDRAIATSRMANGEPLPDEEKARLRNAASALSEKYAERTRENAAARSRELAGLVEQSVRILEAPGRRGSPALRLLSKLPFGIGAGLAHGVGDFRKRFETAVSRGGDAGMVARVATVFRETWEGAMRNIRGNGGMGSRAMNTAEAVAMIGSAYGVSATVTALEQVLPSLRLLDGGERNAMSRLVAEGRLNVQEAVDDVLPRAERVMRRAA